MFTNLNYMEKGSHIFLFLHTSKSDSKHQLIRVSMMLLGPTTLLGVKKKITKSYKIGYVPQSHKKSGQLKTEIK